MKPGYLTTEFWLTAAMQLIALLVLLGKVSPSDAAMLKDTVSQLIATVGDLLKDAAAVAAAAAVLWKYIQSRTTMKLNEMGVAKQTVTINTDTMIH